jgi:diguanylate cyclase (GGDEF)-like protein
LRSWTGRALLLLFTIGSYLGAAAEAGPVGGRLEIRSLPASVNVSEDQILGGAVDADFTPLPGGEDIPARQGVSWLELLPPTNAGEGEPASDAKPSPGVPVVVVHGPRRAGMAAFAAGTSLSLAAALPTFRGRQDRVFILPNGNDGQPVYVRIDSVGSGSSGVSVSLDSLDTVLGRGADHALMIALAVGGMSAMALAALLIWFVMADEVFVLYSTFFFLEALYIAFLSGQGFDWPGLSHAEALGSFAWNVPVGLSGAVGCLFAREIAQLKEFSPRMYQAFAWFAISFLALTVANLAKLFGFSTLVSAVGNLMFSVLAVFTITTAFWSWWRGNRAAGWFLIAWGLLEGFTITAAVRFLLTNAEDGALLYVGLPMSMVAAGVLIALGVADRLRQQRVALTEAQRHARTDPLTGVLNRRSLLERLDAACLRARVRGLPIAVLFIDLDHFKVVNDSHGHQAGDDCLCAIIEPIHLELRQSDVIGRYGGEEFVVILSSADTAVARLIAQRILERVADVRVTGFGEPIAITCSIGVAGSDTAGVWGEELINLADTAVYAAKRLGRNQVQVAPGSLAVLQPTP